MYRDFTCVGFLPGVRLAQITQLLKAVPNMFKSSGILIYSRSLWEVSLCITKCWSMASVLNPTLLNGNACEWVKHWGMWVTHDASQHASSSTHTHFRLSFHQAHKLTEPRSAVDHLICMRVYVQPICICMKWIEFHLGHYFQALLFSALWIWHAN